MRREPIVWIRGCTFTHPLNGTCLQHMCAEKHVDEVCFYCQRRGAVHGGLSSYCPPARTLPTPPPPSAAPHSAGLAAASLCLMLLRSSRFFGGGWGGAPPRRQGWRGKARRASEGGDPLRRVAGPEGVAWRQPPCEAEWRGPNRGPGPSARLAGIPLCSPAFQSEAPVPARPRRDPCHQCRTSSSLSQWVRASRSNTIVGRIRPPRRRSRFHRSWPIGAL